MSFYTDNYYTSSIPNSAFYPVEWIYPRVLTPTDGSATALNAPLTTYRFIHDYYNKKSGLEKIKIANTFHKKINLKYPDFSKLENVYISTSSLFVSGIPPFIGVNKVELINNKNLTDFNFSGALSLVNSSNLNLGAILSSNGWYYSPYVYSGPQITLSGNPQLTSFTQNTIITDINKIKPIFTEETGELIDGMPFFLTYNILDSSIKNIDITLRDDTNSLTISSNTLGLSVYDIKYAHLTPNATNELENVFSVQNALYISVNLPHLSSFNVNALDINLDPENVSFYTLDLKIPNLVIPGISDIFNTIASAPGKSWFTTKKSNFQNITLSSYYVINLSGMNISVNPKNKFYSYTQPQFYLSISDYYAPDMRPTFCNLPASTFMLWLTGSNVVDRYRYVPLNIVNGVYTGEQISLSSAMLYFYNSVSEDGDMLLDTWLHWLIAYINTDNKFLPGSLIDKQYKMISEPITGRGYPDSLPYSYFQLLSTSRSESLTAAPTGPGSFGGVNDNFGMNKNSVYQWPISCLNNVSRNTGSGKVVLIHPQYGIVARHYLPGGGSTPIGASINFINLNNTAETYSRTITNYVTSGRVPNELNYIIPHMSDLGVVKLNSPLPVSAFPGFHILPKSLWQSNSSTKIPNFYSEFFLSQDMDVTPRAGYILKYPKFEGVDKDEYGMHLSGPNFNREVLATQSKIIRTGDSSHPSFMFINNKPVLNGLAYYTTGEQVALPSVTYFYPHIQAIVNELEGQPVQLNLITQSDADMYNDYL